MTTKNKNIILLCACACLIFVLCSSMLAGCSGKNYTYAEFQQAYAEYQRSNTWSTANSNTIFDTDGQVSVNYANTKLAAAIDCESVADYRLMFTRLSDDPTSEQAIFEPALSASMLFISKYISLSPVKNIPTARVSTLMQKLEDLEARTNTFEFNLVKFETRGDDFDKNNAIDQSFLSALLDSYYQLIVSSCSLGTEFCAVANEYFWSDLADSETGRVAPGKIERYYLTRLTQLVDSYVRFDLATFYGQACIIDGREYFTSRNPAGGINQMLVAYQAGQAELVEFENRYNAGAMSEDERAVVDAYHAALSYDELFDAAQIFAERSLSRIDDITIDLDATSDPNSASQMHQAVLSNFVQNELANKINTQLNIMNRIRAV